MAAVISVEEDSDLFVTQYAESIVDFSSQYGSDSSISYSAVNLAGEPNVYPGYGDYTLAFVLRTYGPWWESSPYSPKPFKESYHHKYASQDFVELKFEKKVYPTKIDIFETFHPGAVVKILACDTTSFRWHVLWSGMPTPDVYSESHIFSPYFCQTQFSTDLIRIELHHRHLGYYTQLDAVLLTGTKEPLGQPPNPVKSYDDFDYHCGLNAVCSRIEDLPLRIRPSSKLPTIYHKNYRILGSYQEAFINYFELLPTEIIQLIVSCLDLQSLCRMACTSRLMHKLCYDSLLYKEVDLQPYWHKVTSETLSGLRSRCNNIQRLNLSWCGNYGKLSGMAVVSFIYKCGQNLVCVRLANCKLVANEIIGVLAACAPNLEELDIGSCRQPHFNATGYQKISKLTKLKRLNLYRTYIDLYSLQLILRSCPDMEVLNLGGCLGISSYDEVALEIGRSCRKLRSLDLWRAKSLTPIGVKAIAVNCRKLEELDLGWCVEVSSNAGCIPDLVEKCRGLRKLFLTALRTTNDNDIFAIAKYCPNLEQLDILGTREVSPLSIPRLFKSCPHLKFLDISFCHQIDYFMYREWQEDFPHINMKKSHQPCNTRDNFIKLGKILADPVAD